MLYRHNVVIGTDWNLVFWDNSLYLLAVLTGVVLRPRVPALARLSLPCNKSVIIKLDCDLMADFKDFTLYESVIESGRI